MIGKVVYDSDLVTGEYKGVDFSLIELAPAMISQTLASAPCSRGTEQEYQADMPAVNGDSGGPLLHHETGAALGIISRYGFTVRRRPTSVR